MRRNCFIVFLLFFVVFTITSCNGASSYYEEGNYTKALELLSEKKGLKAKDYLMKINCLVNLGRKEEAKESIMLYLLMDEESEDRSSIIDLYADFDFSSVLNLLLLKDSDGPKAQIIRYISYVDLNEYDKAKALLSNYLASQLSITQFATLIVAHPVDYDYIFSFFNAWYNTIQENEKSSFYSLFFYLIKNELSYDLSDRALKLMKTFSTDIYFVESKTNQITLYNNINYLSEKLNDAQN